MHVSTGDSQSNHSNAEATKVKQKQGIELWLSEPRGYSWEDVDHET